MLAEDHFSLAHPPFVDCLYEASGITTIPFCQGIKVTYVRRFLFIRVWNITPPIATPMDCPKPRKNVDMATEIARFFDVAEAWTASAAVGRIIPRPSPGDEFRNIHTIVLVCTSSKHKRPRPRVYINRPIHMIN
jgi:hypothetical protein